MLNKSLKVNTALNAFRMLLTVLVPLITFPYTSRIFLTEGIGQLTFASSVVQIFILVASLGIYTYGVREGSKIRNDRLAFSRFAHELLFINGLSTILTYLIFISCLLLVPSLNDCYPLLLIFGISIGFTALGLDWVYGVYEEYSYITIRQIIIQLFTIGMMFAFVRNDSDIYTWALLLVLSSTGANIFNCVHARKYINFRCQKLSQYKLLYHLKPIFVLFITQLAANVYLNIDTVLLGIQSSEHHVGLYSAAVKLNTIFITCFTAMIPVFVPRIVETLNCGEQDNYLLLLKKVLVLIIALALPTVVGIEMLSKELIILIAGEAFVDAALTLHYLAPIVLISSLSYVIYHNVFIANGQEKFVLSCTIISAFMNLILSVILIPYFHENGAAIASLVSELIAFILALIYSLRFDSSIKKSIPEIINYILGVLVIIAWCFITKLIIDDCFWILVVGIIGSAILYFLFLVIIKDVAGNEIIKMYKVLNRLSQR